MDEKYVDLTEVGNVRSRRSRTERVCLHTYTLATVKKTCYRFSAHYFTKLETTTGEAHVTFEFPTTVTDNEEQETVDRFHQDLLDQDLRRIVAEETEVARNLILANAFSKTDLVDPDE